MHYSLQQPPQENLGEHMDSEIARLHRDGSCPFFSAPKTQKSLGVEDGIFKLDDGTQIPIEDAVDIIRSISLDEASNGKFIIFSFYGILHLQ